MKTVRLKDIADVCGVSTATVSRALNGLSHSDNRTTVMIRRTADEMGYVPNAAALTLKTNRSSNIGVLYEDQMNHEYFSLLLDDLRREAIRRGYDITLIGEEGDNRKNYNEHARRRNLDGVIVIQADFDSAEVIRLATSTIPSVIIDHMYEGCNCVCSDNRASMEQIVRHDYSCLGALWQLKAEGIAIPEQISLIGYDGIRMGQMIPPHLTTYRQNTAGIAAEAVGLLTEEIESPEAHIARHVTVEGRLVEGETVRDLT